MGALYLLCGRLELPARWRYTTQQLGHLRFAHLPAEVQRQCQTLDAGTALPGVALGQRRQIALVLRWGVPLLFMKEDIIGAEDHVLYHHVLVPLEHGIWRQVGRIDLRHLL